MRYSTALILSFVLACAAPWGASAAARSHHGSATGGAAFRTTAARAKAHPTGIATWFGPGFYGKKTACGQTLTPLVIGVANRTLPCGTLVKVVYAGHALVVPVLDRGPYSHFGAEWDLTAGAAAALGVTETVHIAARIVGSAANSPVLGQPPAAATATLAGGASAG